MPTLNNFRAHIITVNPDERFPAVEQIIPEFGCKKDGNKVTCSIPVTNGAYFAAWWWQTRNGKGTPYSAEFIRDGESVTHLFFGKDEAAKYTGVASEWEDENGEPWKFQFRALRCTGEDNDATKVPDQIGTLELVIRSVKETEVNQVKASAGKRAASKYKAANSGVHASGSKGGPKASARGSGRADTGHEGYKRAQALHRAPAEHEEDVFHDWKDPKPRHTHTAEMIHPDGLVWKCRAVPLRSLPKSCLGDEQNVIARYVFNYMSLEKVKMFTSAPRTRTAIQRQLSSDRSPPPKRARREDQISVTPPSKKIAQAETPPPVKTEADLQREAMIARLLASQRRTNAKLRKLGYNSMQVKHQDDEIIVVSD